jgi:hypothetical protein
VAAILFGQVATAAPITPDTSSEAGTGLSLEDLLDLKVESVSFFKIDKNRSLGSSWTLDMADYARGPAQTIGDLCQMYIPGVNMGVQPFSGQIYGTRGIMIDNNAKTLVMYD